MKHLLNNIKVSNCKVLAQFQVGDLFYNLNIMGKFSSISLNGHEIIDCSNVGMEYGKIAHLLKDLVVNGAASSNSASLWAYLNKDAKLSDALMNNLKRDLDSSIKIINQSMEIPRMVPSKLDLEEAFALDKFVKKIIEFSQNIHDINETLRVCRNDILSISCGRLVNTMWGAKPTQQILENMKNMVANDENWERIEFYANMIIKSIERLTHKLNGTLFDVRDEDKKVAITVLIPNILQGFDKIKEVVSNVLKMLSNFVYIDEVFKKNTSYPANWFINSDMFEDVKLDYGNLILFALKIPRFEQEILYPLDMMKHSFVSKNELRR
jgi:hypothetical protein